MNIITYKNTWFPSLAYFVSNKSIFPFTYYKYVRLKKDWPRLHKDWYSPAIKNHYTLYK